VEVLIGDNRTSYSVAASHPGVLDPIHSFAIDQGWTGRWVMITRFTPPDNRLALCEVMVMGYTK